MRQSTLTINNLLDNVTMHYSNLTHAELEHHAFISGDSVTANLLAQVDDNLSTVEALENKNYKLEQKIEALEYSLQCANDEIQHLARQLLRYEG